MYEGVSSPIIHRPKTLSEFAQTSQKATSPLIWSGGSSIMTGKNTYPLINSNFDSIIYLGDIKELEDFQRNDRIAEFGAMVNLYDLANYGKNVLPSILLEAINSIGVSIITKRATLGGALSIVNPVTSIVPVMIALNASVELRYMKKKRFKNHWIQASQLIDKNGQISIPPKGLITKVRVGVSDMSTFGKFLKAGSYNRSPEETVFGAFVTHVNQNTLSQAHLVLTFPTVGTYTSRDMDNIFNSLKFPIGKDGESSLIKSISTFIDSSFSILPLQKALLEGFIEDIVGSLNEIALTEPNYAKGESYE